MSLHKKPNFKVVYSSEDNQSQRLTYKDSYLDHPDHVTQIIELRVAEFKRRHPEYDDTDIATRVTDIPGLFEFLYHEVFTPEYEQRQRESILSEMDNEQKMINHLFSTRLQEITERYPDIEYSLDDLSSLPEQIREHLFAPPLMLTEDNCIMLFND